MIGDYAPDRPATDVANQRVWEEILAATQRAEEKHPEAYRDLQEASEILQEEINEFDYEVHWARGRSPHPYPSLEREGKTLIRPPDIFLAVDVDHDLRPRADVRRDHHPHAIVEHRRLVA